MGIIKKYLYEDGTLAYEVNRDLTNVGLDAGIAIAFIISQSFILLYRCDVIHIGGDCKDVVIVDEQIGCDTKDIKVDITKTIQVAAIADVFAVHVVFVKTYFQSKAKTKKGKGHERQKSAFARNTRKTPQTTSVQTTRNMISYWCLCCVNH